jgi:hypothetical protein
MLNRSFSIARHELLSTHSVYWHTQSPRAGLGANAMPADVSFTHVSPHAEAIERPSRRFPLGIGLVIAATASVGLWVGVVAGVKALFF